MGRKLFVGGNWKCNGTTEEVKKIVSTLNGGEVPSQVVVEVVVSPPFVFLPLVKSLLRPDFHVAAQNCWVKKGSAFTGEVIDDNKNAKPDSKEIGDAMMEERDSDNGKDKMLVTQNGDNGIAEDDDEIDPLDAFMNSMVLPEVEKLNNAVVEHPTTAGDDKNENLKKDKKDGFSNGGQQRRKDSNKALGRIISGHQQNESFTCSSRGLLSYLLR